MTKYHCAKLKKKLMGRFQVTLVSDGRTDAWTDMHEFIGPFQLEPEVQKARLWES